TLVSEALSLGYKIVVIPSTGNAAISLGYFGNKAGIETLVFLPENTPPAKTSQITKNSKVIFDSNLVESYEHCFEFCNRHEDVYNGFPANNIPYMQGLKTISYEIFLQLGEVPDWIVTPVGSGGNIVAQYIGFKDLNDLGLTNKMPRFVAVQVSGADPITVGFQEKQLEKIVVLENLRESKAEAIASDTCLNHFKIMNIIKETGGTAISVTESEIDACLERRFEYSSCSIFPAIKKLRHKQEGKLGKVVLVATAANRK
ncbi:MAG: pyridoxal-phosphate dependent enzyme, partial [Candidatus Woesearchaeota archaeon]